MLPPRLFDAINRSIGDVIVRQRFSFCQESPSVLTIIAQAHATSPNCSARLTAVHRGAYFSTYLYMHTYTHTHTHIRAHQVVGARLMTMAGCRKPAVESSAGCIHIRRHCDESLISCY